MPDLVIYRELPALEVRASKPLTWNLVWRTVRHCAARHAIAPPMVRFFVEHDPSLTAHLNPVRRAALSMAWGETFESSPIIGRHSRATQTIWIGVDGPRATDGPLTTDLRAAGVAAHEFYHYRRANKGPHGLPGSEERAREELAADRYAVEVLGQLGLPRPKFLKGGTP